MRQGGREEGGREEGGGGGRRILRLTLGGTENPKALATLWRSNLSTLKTDFRE